MSAIEFQNYKLWASLSLLGMIFSAAAIVMNFNAVIVLPHEALLFMIVGLILAIVFNIIMFKQFILGFLLSVLFTLIAARIAALYGLYIISIPLIFSIIIMIIHYWQNAISHLVVNTTQISFFSIADYQLTFLRMYVGFDFVPHFTEKLLAGTAPRLEDIHAFTELGILHAQGFVILAGFCELGAAIALGLGLLTRMGAILTGLYLLIATYLGKHFTVGFIWAGTGGGWEYPLMWIVFVLVFAISGGSKFSLDACIVNKYKIPKFIRRLMGQV